jgi:hypothetical protein
MGMPQAESEQPGASMRMHRSTAIALLVTASVIIVLNSIRFKGPIALGHSWGWAYGWPMSITQYAQQNWPNGPWLFKPTPCVFDIVFALLLLLAVKLFCDWRIRRRAEKAHPPLASRPRFQVHLSTVVLLTLVTGALMGANLSGRHVFGSRAFLRLAAGCILLCTVGPVRRRGKSRLSHVPLSPLLSHRGNRFGRNRRILHFRIDVVHE